MAAHIASFTGSNMLLEPHLLESGEAQRAHNVQYERGSARSFREPLPAGTLPAGSVSIYPVDGQWMAWGSDAVSVDAGPAIQDTRRIYYTGDGYRRCDLQARGRRCTG